MSIFGRKKKDNEVIDTSPKTWTAKDFIKPDHKELREKLIEKVNKQNFIFNPLIPSNATQNGKNAIMDWADATLGVAAGYGESISNVHLNYFGNHGFIGYQSCALLAQHWLINLACTVPVQDAIRKGWKLTKNDGKELTPETLAKIAKLDKKLKITESLEDFGKFGRVYGVRVAVFQVESDDKDYYKQPFNIDAVGKGKYKGIILNDPYYCTPQQASNNQLSVDFYEPEYWMIGGQSVHKSHCVIFRHAEVAQILKPSYIYGGLSLTQMIFEAVYNAEVTATEIPQLIQNMRLYVMQMEDLERLLLNPVEMDQKLSALAEIRNNYGTHFIDSQDNLQQIQTSLAGLEELSVGRYKLVASVAEMPVCKLLKTDQTGGLVKGGGEEATYHETLESLQTKLLPLLERHYLLLGKSSFEDDFGLEVVFEKLDAMTESEAAELQRIKAETDTMLIDRGVIDGMDARRRLIADKDSGYNGLDENDLPEPPMPDDEPPRTQKSDEFIKQVVTDSMMAVMGKSANEQRAEQLAVLGVDESSVYDNADNYISKDDAIQAAIEHLESDQTQSDIPESEKPEDAALVETLKAALSQKERYPKIGGITIAGLPLAIENPEHSTREGIDPDGTSWQTTMRDHYGYIEGVIGHDGDELDMFLKPGTPADWTGNIYVIEQTSPQGEYDEDKVMIGYGSDDEAKDAYMSNYSDDWDGFSDIETYTIEEFRDCCDHLNDDISDENNN